MELNLCPACNAFVSGDWETCRACGHALVEQAIADPELVESELGETAGTEAYEVQADEVQYEDVASEDVGAEAVEYDIPEWGVADHEVAEHEVVGQAPTEHEQRHFFQEQPEPVAAAVSTPAFETPVFEAPVFEAPVFEAPKPESPPEWEAPGWAAPGAEAANSRFAPANYEHGAPANYEHGAPANNEHGAPANYEHPSPQAPEEAAPLLQTPVQIPSASLATPIFLADASKRLPDGRLAPEFPIKVIGGLCAGALALFIVLILVVSFIGGVAKERNEAALTNATTTTTEKATEETTTTVVEPKSFHFTDPNGKFEVELPAEPTKTDKKLGDYDATMWTATTKDKTSAVYITTVGLPAGPNWERNDAILNAAANDEGLTAGGRVKSQIITTASGHRQLDARLVGDGLTMDGRFFVEENTLYVLLVAAESDNGNAELFGQLKDTFELKKP